MKKFNKFTDEASYTSFIQNIAEPGYYTSWVVGNLNIGDDIYSDGTDFYNYAAEGTELIGSYCGKINGTYYIKAPEYIMWGYFLTLSVFHEEMPYPENISSYNSYNNIPYLVSAARQPTSYVSRDGYDVYRLIDMKSQVGFGNLVYSWEGWNTNRHSIGAESYEAGGYEYNIDTGQTYYSREVYTVDYPDSSWYVESNYRAWGIESLLEYRKTTGLNWEIPTENLDLGDDIFYYESAARTAGSYQKKLIPVLPVENIHTLLSPFHYDYVKIQLHIYSDYTIVLEQLDNNFVDMVVISPTSYDNEVYFKFFEDIPTQMRLPSSGTFTSFKVSHYADYREILNPSKYSWYSTESDSNYASSKDFYISYHAIVGSNTENAKFRLYRTCIDGDYIEDSKIRIN